MTDEMANRVERVRAPAADEWARCRHWIEGALEHDGGLYLIEDVEAAIEAGEATFWPGRESACVTQFWEFPRAKALNFWLAGGDLEELLGEMLPEIEAWARAHDCTRLVVAGRRGWARAMRKHGYAEYWTALGKEIEP